MFQVKKVAAEVKKEGSKQNILVNDFIVSGKCLQDKYQKYNFINEDCKAKCGKTCKLMRSTWLGLAFTRFRYLTDFQENDKCNSCFVTISIDIQVKYCLLDDR